MLANATDAHSLKEHLMFKLQEQLRNMYPDSLKLVDDIDIEIAKDINKCSREKPIMWSELRYRALRDSLAFPNPFHSGVLGFLTQRVFTYETFTLPARTLFYFVSEVMRTPTWSQSFTRVFELFHEGASNIAQFVIGPFERPKGH